MAVKKSEKEVKKPSGFVVFIKVVNAIFSLFSLLNLFLLLATAGAWKDALEEIFVKWAVSEPYTINFVGILFAFFLAFIVSDLIAMIQIKGKNYVENGSIVLNFGFLFFIAIIMTINISAFPYIFAGIGLSLSIIMSLLLESKTSPKTEK